MVEISRRWVLRGGAAAGAAMTVGGAWALYRSPGKLLVDVLAKALPGVKFDPEGLAFFQRDFYANYFEATATQVKLRAVSMGSGVVGLDTMSSIGAVRGNLLELEREAVTVFLSNSDFFLLDDPTVDPVMYFGIDKGRPCANPFARFEFEDS